MRWLTRIGKLALQVATGLETFGPIAKQFTPDPVDRIIDRAQDLSSQSAAIIVQAEIMGQALSLPGPDKLKMAAPAMAQVILKSDAMIGKKIKDAALFQSGITKITDGWADILNSLDGDDLKP